MEQSLSLPSLSSFLPLLSLLEVLRSCHGSQSSFSDSGAEVCHDM